MCFRFNDPDTVMIHCENKILVTRRIFDIFSNNLNIFSQE